MRILRVVGKWLRDWWRGYSDEYITTIAYVESLIGHTDIDQLHWGTERSLESALGVGYYFTPEECPCITFFIGYANVGLANPHALYVNNVDINVPRRWLVRLHRAITRNRWRQLMEEQEAALEKAR